MFQHVTDNDGNEPTVLANEITETVSSTSSTAQPIGSVKGNDNLNRIYDAVKNAKLTGQSMWGDGDSGYARPKNQWVS